MRFQWLINDEEKDKKKMIFKVDINIRKVTSTTTLVNEGNLERD